MTVERFLNRPGRFGRFWRRFYEAGYASLKAVVLLAFRPVFLIRRVGPAPVLPPGGVLLCGNHTSYLDPAFVQLVLDRRVTFVMTNDFYDRAWGRWFFRLVGAVPIGGGRMGRDGLRRAAAFLRRGHVVCLFPEGRLSRDGTMGRPQRGVGYLARRLGVAVHPMGIAGAYRAWPRGARRPHRADVRVAFGPPLLWEDPPGENVREKEQSFANTLMAAIGHVAEGLPPRHRDRGDRGDRRRRVQPSAEAGR